MPLQIIGQEAVQDANNMRNSQVQNAEMVQNAIYKGALMKQMAEKVKLEAKIANDDVQKTKLTQDAHLMDYVAKGMEWVSKQGDPKKAWQIFMQTMGPEYITKLGGMDRLKQMGEGLEQSPEADYNTAQAEESRAKANYFNADPMVQAMRQKQGGGQGQPGGPGMLEGDMRQMSYSRTPSGPSSDYKSLQNASDLAYTETAARESAKPLSLEEQRVYSATGTVSNAITSVIDLLTTQGAKGGLRTDFGQPILAGGKQKDLILQLNHLKNVIPFARGGKQLTPFESKLVFRLLNTYGKTNEQIIRDLQVYDNEFKTMVRAMLTPRGKLDTSMLEFGGGKTYEELTGGNGGSASSGFTIEEIE